MKATEFARGKELVIGGSVFEEVTIAGWLERSVVAAPTVAGSQMFNLLQLSTAEGDWIESPTLRFRFQ
jgi:hypothetical protein